MIGSLQSFAQSEDKSKRPSPAKTAEGKLGDAMISINYSSPSVKGRDIYGDLVPFDKVWRAGANEATTMEFSKDVKVAGKDLKAGKYAFFVIPKKDGNWTIIFNTVADQWGAYNRDKAKDALSAEAKTSAIDNVEMLTYHVKDGMIHLDWATTRLSFEVK